MHHTYLLEKKDKNSDLNVFVVFGCGCGLNFPCYLCTIFLPHQALLELVIVRKNKAYHWGNEALRSEFLVPPCGLFERGFYSEFTPTLQKLQN